MKRENDPMGAGYTECVRCLRRWSSYRAQWTQYMTGCINNAVTAYRCFYQEFKDYRPYHVPDRD